MTAIAVLKSHQLKIRCHIAALFQKSSWRVRAFAFVGFDGKAFCESSGTWILWGFSVAETVLFENLAGCFCPSRARRQARPGSKTIALKTAIFEPRITLESVDDLGGCIRLLNSLSPATEFTTHLHEYAHLCTVGRCPVRPAAMPLLPTSAWPGLSFFQGPGAEKTRHLLLHEILKVDVTPNKSAQLWLALDHGLEPIWSGELWGHPHLANVRGRMSRATRVGRP